MGSKFYSAALKKASMVSDLSAVAVNGRKLNLRLSAWLILVWSGSSTDCYCQLKKCLEVVFSAAKRLSAFYLSLSKGAAPHQALCWRCSGYSLSFLRNLLATCAFSLALEG